MGFFDAVVKPTDKSPQIRDYKVQGSGVIEMTGARMKRGEQPRTANKMFLIVDGVNVDHPACPPGTKITVMITDMGEVYAGKDIGRLCDAATGDPTPAEADRLFGESTQACAGVRVGVTVLEQPYGSRSDKFGSTFLGTTFYRVTDQSAAPAPKAPAPPAPPAPAAPKAPAAWAPPAPWELYAPGWYHDGNGNSLSEAEVRAL